MASGSGSGSGRGKNVEQPYDPLSPYYPYHYADFNPFDNLEGVPGPVPVPGMEPMEAEESFQETAANSMTEGSSRTRARTSDIWEHFTKVQKAEDQGTKKFKLSCKYCTSGSYVWRTGDGYGSMRKHLNDKHPDKFGASTTQKKISIFGTGAPPFRFNVDIYREELAKFISVEHLSFSFAERIGLITFLQRGVNPQACKVTRKQIRKTIKTLYDKESTKLQEYFQAFNSSVHIGSDIWSDHWRTHSYMGVTCHWIDEEWILQKRIIAYRVFDDSHTAINISRLIASILDDYSLKHKVFSIGFDNASANTASIPELTKVCRPQFGGRFFHMRCVCHVLNLCVQNGLKVLDIFLNPIRQALQFLWSHPKQMNAWLDFCSANKKARRRFSRDVPTRWNSTFTLLNETLSYQDLLVRFMQTRAPLIELYPSLWVVCGKILDVLEAFNGATFTLSGVYYPTTHLFMVEANNIVGVLDVQPFEPREGENEEDAKTRLCLSQAMEVMREKWLQYYREVPMIYLVACVLDPRVKLDGLNDFLITYYTSLQICDYNYITTRVDEVKKQIIDIYNDFSSRYNAPQPSVQSPTLNVSKDPNKSRGWNALFNRRKNKGIERGGNICYELDSYLSVYFELQEGDDTTFDLLDWWRKHANQYPILSMVAKQVLATPCSTVAVEQAFSAGGNILDERRSKMHPDSLEMQTCLDDWTRASYRQQEIDRATYEFFDDEEATTTTAAGASTANEN